jgi:hypothetical protein
MTSKSNKYLNTDTNVELTKELISEIRLRKFAIECGFKTWKQLKNMFRLFKFIYKKGYEKYFDFNSDINNNGNRNNNGNSNNNGNRNNNGNSNNHNNEWWTYNNPRSRGLYSNIRNGSFRISGY